MQISRYLLLLGLLAAGCAPSSCGGDDDDDDNNNSAQVTEAYRDFWALNCDYEERCAAERGRAYVSRQACIDYIEEFIDFVDDYYASVDGAALGACRTAVEGLACDDDGTAPLPACENVFQLAHPTLEAGGLCGGSTLSSCGDDLFCDYAGAPRSGCAVCVASKPAGQPCEDSFECASGACGANRLCAAARPRLGAPCLDSCFGALECLGPGGSKTCGRRGEPGAACSDSVSCLIPLICQAGVCTQPKADGESCTGDFQCSGSCIFADRAAQTGTCRSYEQLPGAGEPCGYGSGAIPDNRSIYCGQDTYPEATDSACTCRAELDDGQSCAGLASYACKNACIQGVCALPRASGSTCNEDSDCAEGSCGLSVGATAMTCLALQCEDLTPQCAASGNNTSEASAVALSYGPAVELAACGSSTSKWYWTLPVPTGNGSATELLVTQKRSNGTWVRLSLEDPDNPGFLGTTCYLYGVDSSTCSFFPVPETTRLLLTLESSDSDNTPIQSNLILLARTVGDGENACTTPPTNTSYETADVLTPGTAKEARFCSRGTDLEYWFKLNGPFVRGDAIRVDLAAGTEGSSVSFNAGVYLEGSSYLLDSTSCYTVPGGTQSCYVAPGGNADSIVIVTQGNPSLRQNTAFTVTAQKVPPPEPQCNNPPTNRSEEQAITVDEGETVNGRFCPSVFPTEFWWKVDGPFQADQTCELEVTFGSMSYWEQVTMAMAVASSFDGELYDVAYCSRPESEPQATCSTTLYEAVDEIYIRTSGNPDPSSNGERPFSFKVTCTP